MTTWCLTALLGTTMCRPASGRPRLAVAAGLVCVLAAAAAVATPRATAEGQEARRYPAIGAGHYIKEVRDGGRYITLEDKSQWEIDERDRYQTSSWQELEGIAVRWAGGDDAFTYELADTDRDEGASARWIQPAR